MAELFADISHHQTSVDLLAYQRAGHNRIAMKATGGHTADVLEYEDPAFAARWRSAGQIGLRRMAYHYARNRNNGAAEWRWFISRVQAAGGLHPQDVLCLDSEDVHLPSRAVAHAREFMAAAVADGYPAGVVYTGRWYAQPYGLTAAVFPAGWRRLWLSHYDQTVNDSQILMPAGWTRDQCIARQFTADGAVPGIGGGCDYSRLFIDWPTTTEDDMTLTPEERGWLKDARDGTGALLGQLDPARTGSLVDKINRTGEALERLRQTLLAGIIADTGRDKDIAAAVAAQGATLAMLGEQLSRAAAGDVDEVALAAALAPAVGDALAAQLAARLAS